MRPSNTHESAEVITEYIDQCIGMIRHLGLGGDEQIQAHCLRLLRSVCRAATHDRMPRELQSKYRGLLRSLRPHVVRLQRAGARVPGIVISEVEDAWKK